MSGCGGGSSVTVWSSESVDDVITRGMCSGVVCSSTVSSSRSNDLKIKDRFRALAARLYADTLFTGGFTSDTELKTSGLELITQGKGGKYEENLLPLSFLLFTNIIGGEVDISSSRRGYGN